MRRPPPVRLALVAVLFGSGCLPVRHAPAAAAPTAASEWPTVYARVVNDSAQSNSAAADRALVDYAQRFPGSPEATEVPYWRAILKVDPNNPTALRESMSMLDAYLAGAPAGAHRYEAALVRRLGAVIEQRNATIAAIPPAPAVRPEDKAKDEELVRLRDELTAANAELARIRRRVARPRP